MSGRSINARIERGINLIGIFGLCGMVTGAMIIEFGFHERPCPLCLLQRLGMIGVASAGLLNLRFGIKPAHYGLGLLCAFMGGAVSLRQTFLHIVPGSPLGPSTPVAGYDLWWWAFITFTVASVAMALAMVVEKSGEAVGPQMDLLAKVGFVLVFLVATANIVISFGLCGLGPCPG
jgi:disulfide bond formation protein DsbB